MNATVQRMFVCVAMMLVEAGASAADLSIMPVAIHLDQGRDRTTVQVTNNGATPVVLQAEAIAWLREAGVDRDAASDDLIVNPSVFTIGAGKTQVVRVGLRRNAQADKEVTYRMVLREVPLPVAADAFGIDGNVRVLVAMRVPVYVAPAAVRREERWHARYDADGDMVAQVTNNGNVHYKVGAVNVQGASAGSAIVAKGPDSVLFPGEVRSFRVPAKSLPAGAPGKPVMLDVTTDRGVQHVALDFAPN